MAERWGYPKLYKVKFCRPQTNVFGRKQSTGLFAPLGFESP